MSRSRVVHRCSDCGATSPKWAGRCPSCNSWNSLVEEATVASSASSSRVSAMAAGVEGGIFATPVAIADVDVASAAPRPTGIGELDRVLGGGLVPGGVTLIGGEPGIGKSTLLLQAMASLSASTATKGGAVCLLVSAEESAEQVKRRALRLGELTARMWLVAETSLPGICAAVEQLKPDVLVVDSIQTIFDPGIDSPPGSVAQVRGCAQALVGLAKSRDLATVLVGHVTKEGSLAGPRLLEHVVDTVLSFEGERHHALRLLRASKHRFGSTGELGLFEMTADGLSGVADPSSMFLADRRSFAAGSVVFPALEGQRPLLVELQALVTSSPLGIPRRSASGLDSARLALLVAVCQERAGLDLARQDVYASAVGGVRVVEPGADLAICLALVSALAGTCLPEDLVVCGEVGLAGELRQVSQTPRRLAEASRLGFTRAIVPASAPPGGPVEAIRASTLAEAIAIATGLGGAGGAVR